MSESKGATNEMPTCVVPTHDPRNVAPVAMVPLGRYFCLSFFLSWVAHNTQLNHWTGWVVRIQFIDCTGPKTLSRTVANLLYGRYASGQKQFTMFVGWHEFV